MSITGQMDKLVEEICSTEEFYNLYLAEKKLEEREELRKEVLLYERKILEIEKADISVIERKRQTETWRSKNSQMLKDRDVEKYLFAKSAFRNLRRKAIGYINRRIDDNLEVLGLD